MARWHLGKLLACSLAFADANKSRCQQRAPAMPLTDIGVRQAKPAEKPFKLSDGGGLHLLVTPTGGKLWRLAYRFDGKQLQLAFGGYPEVSLKDARAKRDAAKETLATGVDPGSKAKIEKLTRQVAAGNTFGRIADEYVTRLIDEGRADATVEKVRWLLSLATPTLDKRPIGDISAAEVLAVLRAIEKRGTHETARRLRSTIGTVFRYAIATAPISRLAIPFPVPAAWCRPATAR